MHLRRRFIRAFAVGGVLTLASVGFTVATATPAAATTQTPMTATATYNAQGSARFQSNPVASPTDGTYVLQTNLWNKAVSGSYNVNWDNQSTAWSLTNNTADSYFPGAPGSGTPGIDSEPPVPGYTCTANSDSLDKNCNWAGHGDPWVNPNTGADDGTAVTTVVPSFIPQQPAAPQATHVVGLSSEFSNQIHAPASYADMFLGCHWANCSPGTLPGVIPAGAPFPLQYTGVAQLDSVWNINVPATGEYDASYDIWLDSNTRNCATSGTTCASPPAVMPYLPTQPNAFGSTAGNPGQNDGAEVMIWAGSHGYTVTPSGQVPLAAGAPGASIIQPAGKQVNLDSGGHVVPVAIPGIDLPNGQPAMFDVWAARSRSFDNGIRWNVITFVNRNPITVGGLVNSPALPNGGFDGKAFLNYAAGLGSVCSTDPTSPIAGDTAVCLNPAWWLTSVQAGYEIWNVPQSATMATTQFSVKPIAVSGGINTGGRSCPAPSGCAPSAPTGTPLINWLDTFNVVANGCTGDTNATWQLSATNFLNSPSVPNVLYPATLPATGAAGLGRLTESPAGSGNYVSVPQAGPLNNPAAGYIFHDVAQIKITIHCNGVALTSTGTVFIDPSGEVVDLNGAPVKGAQVTLSSSPSQTGTFTAVPNGDTAVMSAANTANPSTTDTAGRFRWDVVTGFYEVSATKAGCTQLGGSSSPPEHVLPPPASPTTAIKLILNCGTGPSLPTTVVVRPPGVGQFGYCADITVTNNTSAPVVWNTTFPVPGGQHISQSWNMVYTQVGTQAINVHADPSNPWNATLQPGQSTTSTGFCAVP